MYESETEDLQYILTKAERSAKFLYSKILRDWWDGKINVKSYIDDNEVIISLEFLNSHNEKEHFPQYNNKEFHKDLQNAFKLNSLKLGPVYQNDDYTYKIPILGTMWKRKKKIEENRIRSVYINYL